MIHEERPEVETLFASALAMSTDERARWLDEACQGDRQLRARVDRLLQCHERAGDFLEDGATGWVDDDLQASLLQWCQHAGTSPFASDPMSLDTPTDSLDATSAAARDRQLGTPFDYQYLLEPSADPASLGRLGEYELYEIIGRGGMGVVFRAIDTRLNRPVAIKLMEPWLAIDETAPRRFMREAQAAAAVAHDHVVVIHAVAETAGVPYLVMQYVDGPSLQDVLSEGQLDLSTIVRIGSQIASGLAAAHRRGLIHRDIKPANILLDTETQQVKITDFGLACAVDDGRLTKSGKVTGTPHYMSPEQAQDLPVDARSDLFSLGAVLYAMCTGQSPFQASSSLAALRRL